MSKHQHAEKVVTGEATTFEIKRVQGGVLIQSGLKAGRGKKGAKRR